MQGRVSVQAVENWVSLGNEAQYATGLHTLRVGEHQLVVGRTDTGEVFALDNRCPHEGYPLAQGTLKDCSLTCCWHNWKFDVRDGQCTLGGEGVRSFPVRAADGELLVDVAEPDPRELIPDLMASMLEGVVEHNNGRAIRDAVRLVQAGATVDEIILELIHDDALRAEYGTSHVLALAVDCARLAERLEGPEKVYALAPVLDLAGDTNKERTPRPIHPATEWEGVAALRAAVESEDLGRAEGMLRAAFRAGVERTAIEEALAACSADHLLGFGHPLIYLMKARELFARHAVQVEDIYCALLTNIVYGTRIDTLPFMRAYVAYLEPLASEFAEFEPGDRRLDATEFHELCNAMLDGAHAADALAPVWDAVRSGAALDDLGRVLVAAGSMRLARFDPAIDSDATVAENWLWVSHRFTFASAIRRALSEFSPATALRLLFQGVMFVHSARALDLAEAERAPLAALQDPAASTQDAVSLLELREALMRGSADQAGSLASAALAAAPSVVSAELERFVLDDRWVPAIVVAHAIKTLVAALDETEALAATPAARIPLFGAVRFLAAPVKQRRVREAVQASIDWVVGGRVPRKLTQ